MTYACFEESVLDHADELGNLSAGDARQLLAEHGFALMDLWDDDHGQSPERLVELNAEALLAWLGY